MKSIVVYIISLGLLQFVNCKVFSQTEKLIPLKDIEVHQIEILLEKYEIASENEDIEMIKDIFSDKEDVVIIGTDMEEILSGWKSIREAFMRQFNSLDKILLSSRERKIKVNDTLNTAWFSEIINYNFVYNGTAKSYEGIRFTGVIEKTDGTWKIVQSHLSIPASSY
jgi:ketosteroid isomerase-like protein